MREYSKNAYNSSGELWWESKSQKTGRPLGDERRMAAWLAYALEPGEIFTMPQLREALSLDGERNVAEHLNRRLRELRVRDGWIIHSHNTDPTLALGEYKVEKVGWHPGNGQPRPAARGISQRIRRLVLERDGRRCTVCGIGNSEPYPEDPDSKAVMTIGHIIPNSQGGSSEDLDNLRVECKRCNEPVRDSVVASESVVSILRDIVVLDPAEQGKLLVWLESGHRQRSELDKIYDRARMLQPADRGLLMEELLARTLERYKNIDVRDG